MALALPFDLVGGPRSLGEMLIARTSRFFAEPGKQKKKKTIVISRFKIKYYTKARHYIKVIGSSSTSRQFERNLTHRGETN